MLLFDDFSAVQLGILLGGSFIAGILNAISGGGGMVLIPMMVLTGVPPINAIAINKFQNTVGTVAAISYFNASQKLDWRILLPFLILAGIGAAFGVFALKDMAETGLLMAILPYVLIAVAVYSILPQRSQSCEVSSSKWRVGAPIWAVAGVYGGSISIGTGPFLIALDRFFYRSELRDAIVRTKPIMLAVNVVSLSILVSMGFLNWPIAVLLSIGNFVGAKLGARIVTFELVKIANVIVFTVPVVAALRLLANGG
ncbi:sulfite exporter TauE/SafE family protein [Tropicimonas sp. IMCC34043]|uniref:sulfite exporter TauE/SafE family protein n=1 Tax=Tropicimonas sp. IMCC34043 TaxID=2248760 RepID=UPI000E236C1B|nr:sulfite exporter TauE/SafE family protein [Tropicimonas sp. IMCC34043]